MLTIKYTDKTVYTFGNNFALGSSSILSLQPISDADCADVTDLFKAELVKEQAADVFRQTAAREQKQAKTKLTMKKDGIPSRAVLIIVTLQKLLQ